MFILKSTHDAEVAKIAAKLSDSRKLVDKLYAELTRESARAQGYYEDLRKFTGPRDRAPNGRFQRSLNA